MRDGLTRREVLGAGAGAALLPVATGPGAAAAPCEEYREVRAELERTKRELERKRERRDRLAEKVEAFRETIAEGRDAARGPHPYSAATRREAKAVGEPARQGMVFLQMTTGRAVTTASAWFVDEHLLLTNAHNVEELTPRTTRTAWTVGGEKFTWEVVDRVESKSPDVALLRTDYSAPKVLETGSSSSVSEGDLLVQVGNPGGFGKWVLTLGELRRKSERELTSTVPGLSGVSGSPLLDMDGRVVGMTYAGRPKGDTRQPGERPEPSSPELVLYPMAPESLAGHVPIERALEKKEEWT